MRSRLTTQWGRRSIRKRRKWVRSSEVGARVQRDMENWGINHDMDRVRLELHRQHTVDRHKEPGSCAAHIRDGCMAGMSDGCVVGMSDGCTVPRSIVQACVIEVSLACFILPPQTLLLFLPVSTSSIGHQLPPGSYCYVLNPRTGPDIRSMARR